MNFLFWNVQDNVGAETLADLVQETSTEVLVLAEFRSEPNELLAALTARHLNYFTLPTVGCERITIVTSFTPGTFQIGPESEYYSIRQFSHSGYESILLVCVHLPSKQYKSDAETDQLLEAVHFRQDVDAAEEELGNSNTMILGDFNMNPYEKGMVAASAMHSLPSLRMASRETREIKGRDHSFFYNPSWNLFGDLDELPGTYFYQSSSYFSPYWHIFDQVILRPHLAARFDKNSLRIVTGVAGTSFLNPNGRPGLSDHLPIFFRLNMKREAAHAESLA